MPDFNQLARGFDGPGIRAIVLKGSFARGDAGPFSDIDLMCLTDGQPGSPVEAHSYLVDDRLVVVSYVSPAQVEEWFSRPEVALEVMVGLRTAGPLLDREGIFAAVQERARAFVWDASMQAAGRAYVSEEMAGWVEEVHKALQGLLPTSDEPPRAYDTGRLLNARFGLTWGLSRVLAVHRGIFQTTGNSLYEDIEAALGPDSEWVLLRRIAYGIENAYGRAPGVRDQIDAGLRLYVLTAQMVDDALQPAHRTLVRRTVERIEQALYAPPPLQARDADVPNVSPDAEVTLREITPETLGAVCDLSDSLSLAHQRMVEPNAMSIAEAYFEPRAWFRAIYAGEEPVGFLMLYDGPLKEDDHPGSRFLWRLMVAAPYQGQGIGRQAMGLVVERLRSEGASELLASCFPGEGSPEGFYRRVGFERDGRMYGNEVGLRLTV